MSNKKDILQNHISDAKNTLRLLLTKKCNLRCSYCYEEGLENSTNNTNQELDLEDFKKIIQSAKTLGVYRISFSGGEPTILEDWLDDLIGTCVNLKIIPTITTNGTSDSIIMMAKKYPELRIRFSLDFCNSDDYLKYKGVDCFNKVLNNLKKLSSLPNEININRIVFSLGNEWREFNEMINFLHNNNLVKDNIFLKLLPSYPNKDFNKLSVKDLCDYFSDKGIVFGQKDDKLRNKSKLSFVYKGVNVLVQNRGVYSPKCCVNGKRCPEGIGSIRINPSGIIQPCFHVVGKKILHGDNADQISQAIKESQIFLDSLYSDAYKTSDEILNLL